MEYRLVPRTGWQVSALSFGCMRFADDDTAFEALRAAIALGVNYFDVAPLYGGGTAEPRLGRGIAGLRDGLIINAKSSPGNGGDQLDSYKPDAGFGIRTADQARAQIERSMSILGVDHLDMYQLWACHSDLIYEEAMKPGGFMEGVLKARDEGLFDFIGMTTHSGSRDTIRYLQGFEFDMVTLPFSALDPSRLEAVEFCAEQGIGVVAMNPLAGGALGKSATVLRRIAETAGCASMAEAALRYVVGVSGVTTALNGLTYASQVTEGAAAITSGGLTGDVASRLRQQVSEVFGNVKHFCTGCGYCGECPAGILIPQVLGLYSEMLIPTMAQEASRALAARLVDDPEGLDPALCVACKVCEERCPNRLPIAELMADAAGRWSPL